MRPADGRWPAAAFLEYVQHAMLERGGTPAAQTPDLSNTYVSTDGRHAHLLYWYGVPNVYFVVVLTLPDESVAGHHRLDLNEKYGLPQPSDPTWFPEREGG